MPDRLASRIVLHVLEILDEHHVIRCDPEDRGAVMSLNNATDIAIEDVEKLLQHDSH